MGESQQQGPEAGAEAAFHPVSDLEHGGEQRNAQVCRGSSFLSGGLTPHLR